MAIERELFENENFKITAILENSEPKKILCKRKATNEDIVVFYTDAVAKVGSCDLRNLIN